MKKTLAILLSLLLVLSLATACAPAEQANEDTNTTQTTNTTDTDDSTADPADTTEDPTAAEDTPTGTGAQFDAYPHPTVSEDGTLRVGLLLKTLSSEASIRTLNQAQIECEHRGWELIHILYEDDTNFRDSFQNLVNQGVDAIIVGAGQSQEAKIDLFTSAREQGIGVYCNDNQVVEGVISNCTMPNGVASMQLFYKVAADYGWDLDICVIEGNNQQSMIERIAPVKSLIESGAYANLSTLSVQDWSVSGLAAAQSCYEIGQTWMQQYGSEVDLIYTGADTFGINVAEAIAQSGDTHGENTITCGIDGGTRAFAYIREDTPFKYTYAQPFEQYTHNVFEIVNSIQVDGMSPGDPGCPITRAGETLTFTGYVVNKYNCPEVGTNIHTIFDYYDPNSTDAWYTWSGETEIYTVEEYVTENN